MDLSENGVYPTSWLFWSGFFVGFNPMDLGQILVVGSVKPPQAHLDDRPKGWKFTAEYLCLNHLHW